MKSCMSVMFLSTSKYNNRFTLKHSGFLSNLLSLSHTVRSNYDAANVNAKVTEVELVHSCHECCALVW